MARLRARFSFLHQAGERLQCQQAVEVVSRAQVERLALPQARNICHETSQNCGERVRATIPAAQGHDASIHVVRQLCERTAASLATPFPIVAEDDRQAGDHQPYLVVLEVGASPWTEGRDALGLQRREVGPAVVLAHAVEKQRHLAIVRDDVVLLQERHHVGEALCLVPLVSAPDTEHRRVVGMRSR